MTSRSVADDPRYAQVKQLVSEGRDDEAQALENALAADLFDNSEKT